MNRRESPEKRLKDRIVRTVFPRLARGFLPGVADPAGVFEATLTLLYRLLFLLYAEGRELLPIGEPAYRAASLRRMAEEIAEKAGPAAGEADGRLEKAFSARGTTLYDRLTALCRAVDKGDPVLNVPAHHGGLFVTSPDESGRPGQRVARFLRDHKVPDRSLAPAIDRLARDRDEGAPAPAFIDYRTLEVGLLGSIYEGLLEANDRTRRKASGSWYTPDPIVEYIVAHTVGPVLERKLLALRHRPDLLENVFDLKVHDPAMGSGHFLVKAAKFITARLRRFLEEFPASSVDDDLLRRLVLERCIHGVDLDPTAVELARISLWLEVRAPGATLGFLDHRLRCGNSLTQPRLQQPNGFDAVVGNPPYDVLAEKELEADLAPLLAWLRDQPVFQPACVGKVNLYKLFVCLGVHLLNEGGRLGYIVPMVLLGDEQAAGVRKLLLERTSLVAVEAFPQKDDPGNRVFEDAKLASCVFIAQRGDEGEPFRSRVHPGRSIEEDSPSLLVLRGAAELYDPENQPIPACGQEDWDLAVRIMKSGRMKRLGEFARAHQGEVNETIEGGKGNLSTCPADGPLILRGANVCLYVLRDASQGEPVYLRKQRFLRGKKRTAKAWHFLQNRVGFQRSSPQNNFRRLISCLIPAGRFCCDTVAYFPEQASGLPLRVLIGLLNSKLLDWYFRLGSTNSKVNDYQVRMLPVPDFRTASGAPAELPGFAQRVANGRVEDAFSLVEPLLAEPPFPPSVMAALACLVERITTLEAARGAVARVARSALDPKAQPFQDLIDRMMGRMAGLTDQEAGRLERRLAAML
jgi:hypothetical protein